MNLKRNMKTNIRQVAGANNFQHNKLIIYPETFPIYTEQKFFIKLLNNFDDYIIKQNEPYCYKGVLCGKNNEKIINFCQIDSNLITSVLPSNPYEENCQIYIFKCNFNENENFTLLNCLNNSLLIGYCELKFYKDTYYYLSEYLIRSVYDKNSLDDFYLRNFNININSLDTRLYQSFKHILIPADWSILGHRKDLDKCAHEALNCINKQGELPYNIAMKNHFTQIASIMFEHLNSNSSTTSNNSNKKKPTPIQNSTTTTAYKRNNFFSLLNKMSNENEHQLRKSNSDLTATSTIKSTSNLKDNLDCKQKSEPPISTAKSLQNLNLNNNHISYLPSNEIINQNNTNIEQYHQPNSIPINSNQMNSYNYSEKLSPRVLTTPNSNSTNDVKPKKHFNSNYKNLSASFKQAISHNNNNESSKIKPSDGSDTHPMPPTRSSLSFSYSNNNINSKLLRDKQQRNNSTPTACLPTTTTIVTQGTMLSSELSDTEQQRIDKDPIIQFQKRNFQHSSEKYKLNSFYSKEINGNEQVMSDENDNDVYIDDYLNQIKIGIVQTDKAETTVPIQNGEQMRSSIDSKRGFFKTIKPYAPQLPNSQTTNQFNSANNNSNSTLTKALSTPSIIEKLAKKDSISTVSTDTDSDELESSKQSENSASSHKHKNSDVNYTDKELVTMSEFLKEYEPSDKSNHDQKSSTPLLTSLSVSCLNIPSSATPIVLTPTLSLNTNETSTSSLTTAAATAAALKASSQFETQSTKTIPKTRKLGQIFKLASVRGAKSKSMKHKLTTQLQQHSFTSIKCENNCHVCKKSLLNKKAVNCKNCQLYVHENTCKDELTSCCSNLKLNAKKTLPISFTNIANFILTEESNNQENNDIVKTKRDQYANVTTRPKSMDITKTFSTYLSKSTSNMYRSHSNPSLTDDDDDEARSDIVNVNQNTSNTKNEKKLFNSNNNSNSAKTVKCTSYKAINEETIDYDSINRLRESSESLNLKFDEKNANCVFGENFSEINSEFSKYEAEFNVENWTQTQDKEDILKLNKNTRYKQENIFELIKTELNYLKVLNITKRIYVNGIMNDCKVEQKQLDQMFPKLDQLIEIHKKFLIKLIERYKLSSNRKYVDSIGDVVHDFLNSQCDNMIQIYTKFCCLHLIGKNTYNTLLMNNKSFASLLEESRKHLVLRRYQIPDCLTIITQRLAKHLTLIESMLKHSKDDENEYQLLLKSVEKLRSILSKVNEAVAFYQNLNEFKKIYENIDPKSYTYIILRNDRIIEQRKYTKNDLNLEKERKYLAIKQVTVTITNTSNIKPKKHKIYKDVTCVATNDMIMFLQLNDKNKYVFINENSVIPCIPGILIRPQTHESANRASSACLSGVGNSLPALIVNTITNELFELKFIDDLQRNEWLSLMHAHVTPNVEDCKNKDESVSSFETFVSTNEQSAYNNSLKNYRNQTVVYASDSPHALTNAIKTLHLNDSIRVSKSHSTVSENISISSFDGQLSPDMAELFESFNNLIEQALFHNNSLPYEKIALSNIMRSASSAGETITRANHDPHNSIPKRAETFNGASAKDLNLLLNINEIMKSKLHSKSSAANSNGCIPSACSTNSDAISHANTDLSGDSGYQSRLCVDLYHDNDNENYSCSCDINNRSYQEKYSPQSSSSSSSSSATSAITTTTTANNNRHVSPKEQFENLLKCIINDYIRVKDENETLKCELESRGKTIDNLHDTLEQMKSEKIEYERRAKEFEKREAEFLKDRNEFIKQQALLRQHLQVVMSGIEPMSQNSRQIPYQTNQHQQHYSRYDNNNRNSMQSQNPNCCNYSDDNLNSNDSNILFL